MLLLTGIGDKINTDINFPKYYFVLVNPRIRLSTSEMYSKIDEYIKFDKNYIELISSSENSNKDDNGNDFERIVKNENKEISDILNFLSNLNHSIFSRMSGSGSCCYAVFASKEKAKKAFNITAEKYRNYWIYLTENNNTESSTIR